jgi:hypothetical protein
MSCEEFDVDDVVVVFRPQDGDQSCDVQNQERSRSQNCLEEEKIDLSEKFTNIANNNLVEVLIISFT